MKIGKFSQSIGVSVRMLRFYETAGVIAPQRTAAGYREYGAADAAFVRKAAMLNRAGVPLKDIALMRETCAPFAVTFASFAFWFMTHTDLIRGLMSR